MCARGTAALMGEERRNEGAARGNGASRWPRVSGECSSPVISAVQAALRTVRGAHPRPPPAERGAFFAALACSGFSVKNAVDRDIKLDWDEVVYSWWATICHPLYFLKELNQDLRGFFCFVFFKKKDCHIWLMGVERVNSLCALFNTDEGGEFMPAWW